MANEEQVELLKKGVKEWNAWRIYNQNTPVDLSKAHLKHANLREANLSGANLWKAQLKEANLNGADLREAQLREANLTKATIQGANLAGSDLSQADLYRASLHGSNIERGKFDRTSLVEVAFMQANLHKASFHEASLNKSWLMEANLQEANLTRANLYDANLDRANLSQAHLGGANLIKAHLNGANLNAARFYITNLSEASLREATLVGASIEESNLIKADLRGADLSGASLINSNLVRAKVNNARISKSRIYGVSVWDLEGEFKEQQELIITPSSRRHAITVDNIKVAQFVYLLLNNQDIRNVINTLTSKTVLILGRFALPERKAILDALRNKLREHDLLPIVFDFDRPTDKDFTETIKTLAGISYFVIADITNPKSSPLELQATVPDYQIPFVPIIQEGEDSFAMMDNLQTKYPWVLPTRSYDSIDTLMQALKPGIIDPAVEMRNKLRLIKAQEQTTESLRDYLDQSL